MLQQLKDKLIGKNKAAGLCIKILPSNKYEYTLCVLHLNKGKIEIENQLIKCDDVKDIISALDGGIPISIVIDGKGVLHKKAENNNQHDYIDVLSAIIPNAKKEEFLIQLYPSDAHLFVSVVRKKIADQILQSFRDNNVFVTSIAFGVFAIDGIIELIEGDESNIIVDNSSLILKENKVVDFLSTKDNTESIVQYKIGDDYISSSALASYAVGLKSLANMPSGYTLYPEITLGQDEWEQKRIFNRGAKLILAVFMSILIVNTGFYLNFNDTQSFLSKELVVNAGKLERLDKLTEEVEVKRKFLEKIGWSQSSHISYYADRLAEIRPNGINWTSLKVYPVDEKILKKEKRMVFSNDRIMVEGICDSPVILNEWLKEVEKLEWAGKIKGQQYKYDNFKKVGTFKFELLLD